MSRRVRIARTSLSDYTILSPGGREVPRVYAQLRQAVERELGPDHAAIFAEPVFDNDAGHIDWYGPAGTARTLGELDERARERAKDTLRARVEDIEALAGQMEASDDRDRQRMGAALRHALPVPDESSIQVIDGQPILTQWGMVPSGREADLEVLKFFLKPVKPQEPPPPPPPPPPPSRDWRWIPAVMGLVLIVVAGISSWLLLRNCAIALPAAFGGGDPVILVSYCDQDPRDRTALLALIDQLERDLQNQRVRCPQFAQEPEPAPDPVPDPPPEDDQTAKPPPTERPKLTFNSKFPNNQDTYGLCSYLSCQGRWLPLNLPNGGERPFCGPVPKIELPLSSRHEPGPGQCVFVLAPTTWPDVDWPAGASVNGHVEFLIGGKEVDRWPIDFALPGETILRRLREANRPFYHHIKTFNHPHLQGQTTR